MHGLTTIIAMNLVRQIGFDDGLPLTDKDRDAKQASRERWFRKTPKGTIDFGPDPEPDNTLADEAREVVEVYGDAPSLTAAEQLLLRMARELLKAGVDGPAEFPERRTR